jgi:hypothetical protein
MNRPFGNQSDEFIQSKLVRVQLEGQKWRGDVTVTFVAHNHGRLITPVEVQFLPPQLKTSSDGVKGESSL